MIEHYKIFVCGDVTPGSWKPPAIRSGDEVRWTDEWDTKHTGTAWLAIQKGQSPVTAIQAATKMKAHVILSHYRLSNIRSDRLWDNHTLAGMWLIRSGEKPQEEIFMVNPMRLTVIEKEEDMYGLGTEVVWTEKGETAPRRGVVMANVPKLQTLQKTLDDLDVKGMRPAVELYKKGPRYNLSDTRDRVRVLVLDLERQELVLVSLSKLSPVRA